MKQFLIFMYDSCITQTPVPMSSRGMHWTLQWAQRCLTPLRPQKNYSFTTLD